MLYVTFHELSDLIKCISAYLAYSGNCRVYRIGLDSSIAFRSGSMSLTSPTPQFFTVTAADAARLQNVTNSGLNGARMKVREVVDVNLKVREC